MISVPLNLLSVPILMAIWSLDSLLFLVFLRLALRKVPRVQATAAFQALTQLVDPLPRIVEHKMRQPEVSIKGPWLPWCLVVLVLVISRYMLLGLLLALF